MKPKNLFNIFWKSIVVCTLYMTIAYMLGLLMENKVDITTWRQPIKDTMGLVIMGAMIISGLVLTIMEFPDAKTQDDKQ